MLAAATVVIALTNFGLLVAILFGLAFAGHVLVLYAIGPAIMLLGLFFMIGSSNTPRVEMCHEPLLKDPATQDPASQYSASQYPVRRDPSLALWDWQRQNKPRYIPPKAEPNF